MIYRLITLAARTEHSIPGILPSLSYCLHGITKEGGFQSGKEPKGEKKNDLTEVQKDEPKPLVTICMYKTNIFREDLAMKSTKAVQHFCVTFNTLFMI